jgi:predicted PurR-regulated permease PerM
VKALIVRRTLVAVAGLILTIAFGLFFARIPRTVTVFLIAAFIAFGATPLVRRLESRVPRSAAIGIVYLALLGALVIIALVVIPVTYAQVASLLSHAPDYVNASQDLVARAVHALQARLGNRVTLPSVAELQAEVGGRVAGILNTALDSVGAFVVGTVNVLFIGISALILSVFFVSRGPLFGRSLLEFVPPRKREETKKLCDEIASIFGHFIAGQVFLCAIVGVMIWLVLLPLHFSFALLTAVICGLGYAVPFVGMIVAQVLALVLAIPQGGAMAASVTVAIFLISRVADNVLVPKVMSQSVGVSPIGVMFAVFAGGELFGIPGLLLGIPAAALVKVLFKYFVQPYILRVQLGDAANLDVLVESPRAQVEVDITSSTTQSTAEPSTAATSTGAPPAAGADAAQPVVVTIRT